MVEYGKVLSGALRFGIEPKRWLPLFALDILFVAGVISSLLASGSAIADIISGSVEGFAVFQSLMNVGFSIFSMFVVWLLVRLFAVSALIHQSVKPSEYRKSCTVAKVRYFSVLAVSIIVGLVTSIIGMIPYIGWFIAIVIGLMFFFSMPAVIVSKLSFDNALRDSYRLFRDRFTEVLISWLLITIISGIIAMIFMIPLFVMAFNLMLPDLAAMGEGATGTEFFSIIIGDGWSLFPGIAAAIAGFAISTVFSLNAQTNLYLQIRKKKGVL